MSAWPIIAAECDKCYARKTIFEYDLDTADCDYQQRFIDFLLAGGWGLFGRKNAHEFEADDDGLIFGLCQKCNVKEAT